MFDPVCEWRDILRREFDAAEGSFLLQLRCGPGWDWDAYRRLFIAMRECCKAHEGEETVERWIAEGFWYLDWFPRQQMEGFWSEYRGDYENALVNFNHFAYWLFAGVARPDDQFEPLP